MSTSKKILTAALVALTVTTAGIASAGSAFAGPHHHRHGWGWGAGGLAAGLVIGSALASRPAYAEAETVYAEPVRRCTTVERVNRWGEVIGTRRVCRTYE